MGRAAAVLVPTDHADEGRRGKATGGKAKDRARGVEWAVTRAVVKEGVGPAAGVRVRPEDIVACGSPKMHLKLRPTFPNR